MLFMSTKKMQAQLEDIFNFALFSFALVVLLFLLKDELIQLFQTALNMM